jgi:hypothetical protein
MALSNKELSVSLMLNQRTKLRICLVGMLIAAGTWLTGPAYGSLIDDTVELVHVDGFFPFTEGTALVGNSVEFTSADAEELDLTDNSIIFRTGEWALGVGGGADFIWWTLESLDWFNDPTGFITDILVTGNGSISTTGSTLNDWFILEDGHTVSMRSSGISGSASISSGLGGEITIELVTSHTVPEPTTLTLLSLGLVGLGVARHKKKA